MSVPAYLFSAPACAILKRGDFMKRRISICLFLLSLSFLLAACGKQEVVTKEGIRVTADPPGVIQLVETEKTEDGQISVNIEWTE